MNYRLPDGAAYEGRDDAGMERFRVSIPLDDHGYFGRECPSCGQVFRVLHDDYEQLPDDLELWCVYCGHHTDHSEFMTQQQRDRVMRVVSDFGVQMVGQALGKAFRGRSRASRSGVGLTFRSKPFYPKPLPGIDEEQLIRQRACPACGLHYAVFGEHRFCPVSGSLIPVDVALDALAAESAKLDVLESVPAEAKAALREQGVFDRLYVSALASVVGIVETLAGNAFRSRVAGSDALLKGKGNVFQRLDDLAALYRAHLGTDLRSTAGLAWDSLIRLWATRHVHVHQDGIVDGKFLLKVPNSPYREGQRLIVTAADARLAIEQAKLLCAAIG
jgi:DNA-directed RNA polymerase subunit RPC12/RpoP